MKLSVIETGKFKLDGGAMFGIVPKPIWNKTNPADENNRIDLAMRALLIEDGKNLILIDNGLGDKVDDKFRKNYAVDQEENNIYLSLKKHGYSPEDITDVILTHLHFDHAGGSTKRMNDILVPSFSNAKYWIQEKHWKEANAPNAREKASFIQENFACIQSSGQLNFVENQLFSWMDLHEVNGHTEGMQLPLIRYKNYQILYCADLFPTSGHIPLPYIMAYDMQPLVTLKERECWLPKLVQEEIILFFEHDPIHEMAIIEEKEGKYKMKEKISLNQLC